ncbi:MAG: NAD-dependent epimerase/dehydratase family protein [Nitrospirae bacterium]|nr:NAD-dependent epimerase/dehydratase family protein [Nitrospirota bacterium]
MILVTGGTGFIGQHLVGELLRQGEAVRVLVRSSSSLPGEWQGKVQFAVGDLCNISSLTDAFANVTRVFHLGSELRQIRQMHAANVDGTHNVLSLSHQTGVKHIVVLSSVSVIGDTSAKTIDEDTPCFPTSPYQKTKYQAELLAQEWSSQMNIPISILRASNVFGEGARSADSMLAWMRSIQRGRFIYFDRHSVANYIYVKDVILACLQASNILAQGTYIITDSCNLVDFVDVCSDALGIRRPQMTIPSPIAYLLASLAERILRNSPLTVSRVRALSNRTWYRSNRSAELGWTPPIGYREGLRRTIAWYRLSHRL